jgi:hypothetical protein
MSVTFDCPVCGGKGIMHETIYHNGSPIVERNYPCMHCANSGRVTAEEYMRITGRM